MINNINFKNVQLIVYDFDGVMTDNKALIFEDGSEAVIVNRGDGLGVKILSQLGYKQIILSTEKNKVVSTRAKKLKIDSFQGIADKASVLRGICDENNVALKNVIFVGNDINDKKAMSMVGFPISPSDANEKIKGLSILTLKSKGGDGVIRELAEMIMINNSKKG